MLCRMSSSSLGPEKPNSGKIRLAEAITCNVMDILGYGADFVTVAFEQVAPDQWKQEVYVPDIQSRPETL